MEKETKTLTEKEAYEKALEENPPVEITELLPHPGEVQFQKLSDEDKFQLVTRYWNDTNTMLRSMTAIISQQYLIIRALAETQGIDVKKYLKDIQEKAMLQEKQEIKEEFDKLSKN